MPMPATATATAEPPACPICGRPVPQSKTKPFVYDRKVCKWTAERRRQARHARLGRAVEKAVREWEATP